VLEEPPTSGAGGEKLSVMVLGELHEYRGTHPWKRRRVVAAGVVLGVIGSSRFGGSVTTSLRVLMKAAALLSLVLLR
jgi:hypothetical protein